MDNQNINVINTNTTAPSSLQPKNFFNKKIIFVVLGLVVLGEVIWALWIVFQPQKVIQTPVGQRTATEEQTTVPTIITLNTQNSQVKIGDSFSVSVNFSSNEFTQGADIIINYDPAVLDVETITKGQALVPGVLYGEYPFNSVDVVTGKITASGIASENSGTLTNGLFGTITFKAKKAGNTIISVDFVQGSTTDSNVIKSGTTDDILSEVENLEVSIK